MFWVSTARSLVSPWFFLAVGEWVREVLGVFYGKQAFPSGVGGPYSAGASCFLGSYSAGRFYAGHIIAGHILLVFRPLKFILFAGHILFCWCFGVFQWRLTCFFMVSGVWGVWLTVRMQQQFWVLIFVMLLGVVFRFGPEVVDDGGVSSKSGLRWFWILIFSEKLVLGFRFFGVAFCRFLFWACVSLVCSWFLFVSGSFEFGDAFGSWCVYGVNRGVPMAIGDGVSSGVRCRFWKVVCLWRLMMECFFWSFSLVCLWC